MKRFLLLLLVSFSVGCVTEPVVIEPSNTTFTFFVENDYLYPKDSEPPYSSYYVIHDDEGHALASDTFIQGQRVMFENPEEYKLAITFIYFSDFYENDYSLRLWTYNDLENGDFGLVRKQAVEDLDEINNESPISNRELVVENVPSGYTQSRQDGCNIEYDYWLGGDWKVNFNDYSAKDFYVLFQDEEGQNPSRYLWVKDIRDTSLLLVDFNQLPTTQKKMITIADLDFCQFGLLGEQNSPKNVLTLSQEKYSSPFLSTLELDIPNEMVVDLFIIDANLNFTGEYKIEYQAKLSDLPSELAFGRVEYHPVGNGLNNTKITTTGDFDRYQAYYYTSNFHGFENISWQIHGEGNEIISIGLDYEIPQEIISESPVAYGRLPSVLLRQLHFTDYRDKTPKEGFQYWCSPTDNQAEISFSSEIVNYIPL